MVRNTSGTSSFESRVWSAILTTLHTFNSRIIVVYFATAVCIQWAGSTGVAVAQNTDLRPRSVTGLLLADSTSQPNLDSVPNPLFPDLLLPDPLLRIPERLRKAILLVDEKLSFDALNCVLQTLAGLAPRMEVDERSTSAERFAATIEPDLNWFFNVRADYDSRPIGGIVHVRLSLNPSFTGIGRSSLPIMVEQYAQAVDELTPEVALAIAFEMQSKVKRELANLRAMVSPRLSQQAISPDLQ